MSIEQLQNKEIYRIMFHLTTRDVLRCMQVSKHLQAVLSAKYFWKKFLHHRFNLNSMDEYDGPLYQWNDPNNWFCYFSDVSDDVYVIRPFPTMWKCGVVVPAGLDHVPPHIKYLQGLNRALEILVRMKQGITSFHLECGNQCSPNEGSNDISVVLFPWDKEELPSANVILAEIFHFHPEICGNAITTDHRERLHFHLAHDSKHDSKTNPCLNQVFGVSSYWESGYDGPKEELRAKQTEYFTWLQKVMVPTRRIITGDTKLNPVVEFFITKLAPGWVGGALTGQTWT